MKTETCKPYSRDFWIFLPKIIKIDLYNSELYRFKVGAFCLRRSVVTSCLLYATEMCVTCDASENGCQVSQ